MPRIRRSLSAMIVAGTLTAPLCAMPVVHAAASAGPVPVVSVKTAPSQHAMSVDGVALTVTNPDMPVGASFTPKPGDSVQSASAEASGPFRFFSVTAVPFGEQLPKSDYPVAAPGGAAAWRSVGGASVPGPVATLFGQKVTAQVRHEADGTSKIQTVQWIVEAGQRIWIIRAEHAEPAVPTGFGTGIAVTAASLSTPTTVNVTAANTGAQPHTALKAATAAASGDPAISVGTLASVPSSYWDHGNGTCDGGYYSLLNEKIDGLQVCGYSNGNDRATGWGGNEWECAELPMRYAIQRWGLTGNDGGDGKDQADNLTAALNKIHPGRFVLRGNSLSDHTAPQPGDVIAYYDSGAGHTGVVLASHVDASGNGTIDMVHQNWNEVPSTPGEWDGISVSNGMVENVLGGSGDVHWMHDTSSDVAPSVSAPGGLANGGTYHGTVTVTGSASPNASAYYLHLRPAAGGADIVPHPAIAGGTSFSYQFDTTGASDSPALTIPDGGYQAFIGAVVNGAEVDGPAVSITIANAPAMPTFHAPAGLAYGMITLTASAISSNTTAVHYKVDGTEVGQATSATAFNYTLDTTSLTNGTHTITAYASNAGGRSADTPGVTITVANDRIYALAPDKSAISVYNGTGTGPGAWTAIGGAATQILAGDAGLFAVNPNDGSINKYNGSGSGPAAWTSIGGAAAQFAVGGGHLYGLASDKSAVSVYNGTGTGPGAWTVIGGAATQIYAGDAGLFAVNPNDGSISRYNGSGSGPAAWTVVGGAGAQFAVGGGHLYGLAPDKSSVSEWDGTGTNWHVVGGAATAIYAGGYGLFATNPNDGSISLYNGTGSGPAAWTAIGGPAAAFAVGNSQIAGLAGDLSAVSTYNGSGTGPGAWTAIGNAASQIAIGS